MNADFKYGIEISKWRRHRPKLMSHYVRNKEHTNMAIFLGNAVTHESGIWR